jgi:regulator of protease activity HflC (stomatin/prohibitin superfamily)
MWEILCGTVGFIIILLILAVVIAGIRVVKEYERGVIFRLGRLIGAKGPGLFFVIPVLDKMRVIDLRVRTVDVPPQESMTRDNVTVRVNAVLYYKVADPLKAVNEVENYGVAVGQAAQTTLRNVIGQYMLDDLLRNRDVVNGRLKAIIDEMSDPWGIKVVEVETKDLEIPVSMQRAMAKEAEAEREKRARVIKAQGELEATAKLRGAAEDIVRNPAILELRRMQMITEVGIEQNTTTIILMPSEFITFAKSITDLSKAFTPEIMKKKGKSKKSKKSKDDDEEELFSDDPMLEVA